MKCILCGSDNIKLYYLHKGLTKKKITPKEALCTGEIGARGRYTDIYKCQKCGFIWQEFSFTNKELFSAYEDGVDENYFKQEKQRINLFKKALQKIEEQKSPPGNLLDVGAGAGLFLNVARKRGWKVYGVEPSSWGVKTAKRKFDIEEYNGFFENYKNKSKTFDVITMWDVLEHFSDPIRALKKVKSLLKDDGVLALTTININSWFSKLLGLHWTWLIRIHLWYFNPETFKKMLEMCGFEVLWMGSQTRWFSTPYLLSRFTGKDFSFLPNLVLPAPTNDIIFAIAKKK
ncbi:hypothetical protein A2W13_03800 [Candidatus Woesebacteria bacterium RBG_16_36_11]|uniref:Methyltransferase n=2 Tax=Candidatus Woeseibacteriota TaxID=1752722 RepID=A0A1F7X8R4_9BACT|nr:MAG: hypothetical protein A2Z67_05865 [Candidatus Woesebacteria bacterium RBG_13_36_22]OGM11353.1 MAG: hypothetical protein A2W13_03800 [Candidatus Woesebacteria bacterium RBG_16_36_11]